MVVEDLRQWPHGLRILTDVCVVGAGAAGLVLTRTLAARGLAVVLVESGGLAPNPVTEHLNEGTVTGAPYHYLVDGRARALGGTTTKWAGQCLEMRPEDFQGRTWVPHSGWPIAHHDLKGYLDQVSELFAVDKRRAVCDVHTARGVPPLCHDEQTDVIATVLTPHPGLGRHFLPDLTRSPSIRCVLNATVAELRRDRNRVRIDEVIVGTPEGRRATVSAAAVVLCAGGIENARLLLGATGDGVAPGNRHDRVGRYLQDHPSAVTATLPTTDARRLLGYLDVGVVAGLRYWPKLATTRVSEQRHGIAAASAALDIAWGSGAAVAAGRAIAASVRRRRAPRGRALCDALRWLPDLAAAGYRDAGCARGWPLAHPRRIGLRVQIEQMPDPDSRVTLGRDGDPFGVRRPEVAWRLSSFDARTFARATEVFIDALRRHDLASTGAVAPVSSFGLPAHVDDAFHPSGTTRMSVNERSGVVDRDLAVHGTPNLFVCGSSVFPTAGYANPTQTICALALRLADRLAAADSPAKRRITGSAIRIG